MSERSDRLLRPVPATPAASLPPIASPHLRAASGGGDNLLFLSIPSEHKESVALGGDENAVRAVVLSRAATAAAAAVTAGGQRRQQSDLHSLRPCLSLSPFASPSVASLSARLCGDPSSECVHGCDAREERHAGDAVHSVRSRAEYVESRAAHQQQVAIVCTREVAHQRVRHQSRRLSGDGVDEARRGHSGCRARGSGASSGGGGSGGGGARSLHLHRRHGSAGQMRRCDARRGETMRCVQAAGASGLIGDRELKGKGTAAAAAAASGRGRRAEPRSVIGHRSSIVHSIRQS